MTADLPLGVLINVKEINERCGLCNKAFIMETYLDPLTEKRSHRILCKNCNFTVPMEEED